LDKNYFIRLSVAGAWLVAHLPSSSLFTVNINITMKKTREYLKQRERQSNIDIDGGY
jgi:hypothetical protein